MFAELLIGSILTDESKAKVNLITQINAAYRVWKKRCITPKEFDFLYDQDEHTLSKLLSDTRAASGQAEPTW